MTKIGMPLLACLAIILLACSPDAPTVGSPPTGTRVAEEPTNTPNPIAPPTVGSTSSISSPTPELPSTSTPSAQPQPTETTAVRASPSPQTDAVATVILTLAVAEVSAELPVYSRDDWRHWIDDDGDCQDTRNEVLLAESLVDAAYRSDQRCRVASGRWLAPYSGTVITVPGELDVDHMVPLANAHRSGAWQWSPERKRLYANYLGDPNHLIAVTARANRSKGARGPEEWKPPDPSYQCQYAVDWVTIKYQWDLAATPEEFAALDEMLDTCDTPHQLGVVVTLERPNLPAFGGGTPLPTPAGEPSRAPYGSCDEAEIAGETRVRGSQGPGRGFPKAMVPSARDGDGDGVVCER